MPKELSHIDIDNRGIRPEPIQYRGTGALLLSTIEA